MIKITKANILLVNYNGVPQSPNNLLPDNGLANLAGSLIEDGHYVKILDYSNIDTVKRMYSDELREKLSEMYITLQNKLTPDIIKNILSLENEISTFQEKELLKISDEVLNEANLFHADAVGFKLWQGPGFKGSLKIAKNIKEKSNIKTVIGGPHVDWYKEQILQRAPWIDVAVFGEAEETIKNIAQWSIGKTSLNGMPNTVFTKNGKTIVNPTKRINNGTKYALDNLVNPVYDPEIYPAMSNGKFNILLYDDSRGCPNVCNFCTHKDKSGQEWRYKSPKNIVDELEKLSKLYKTKVFRFSGSNSPPRLMNEIAAEIISRDLKITYGAFGHVRHHGIEDFELLKKAGCYSMFFGVESGSQHILDTVMNKKVKVKQIEDTIKDSMDAGIFTVASLITPAPFETQETLEETYSLIERTNPSSVTAIFPMLLPGTEWYKNPEKFGFTTYSDTKENIMNYQIKFLSPPQLWENIPFKINGMNHQEVINKLLEFNSQIENRGVPTGIEDFQAMIGNLSGMSPTEYRNYSRKNFVTGNNYELQKNIDTVNKNVNS